MKSSLEKNRIVLLEIIFSFKDYTTRFKRVRDERKILESEMAALKKPFNFTK